MDAREYIEEEALKIIKRFKKNRRSYRRVWAAKYASSEKGRRLFIEEQTRRIIEKAIKVFGELMVTADGYVTPFTHLLAEQTHDLLEAGIYFE